MNRIIKVIKESKTFLLAGHYHPDGDAIGSVLALGLALKKLKKKVVMYNRDAIPFNLQFLPGVKEMTSHFPKESFDCAIMLDCAQPKRISLEFAKAVEEKRFGKLICMDHHLLENKVGDIDWIDPKQAATGMVVWDLLKKMKLNRNADIANLVYCTLVVDTGSFRYSNTTADVFKLASELVQLGADPWLVSRNLEESNPRERFILLRASLASLRVSQNGAYASMDLTQAMLKESGANEDLSDEFGNIPRSIEGVEVAAFFREMEDGKTKVSLRSKIRVDVAAIAKLFGGGGHKHAAGCILNCDLASAKKCVEAEIVKYLNR